MKFEPKEIIDIFEAIERYFDYKEAIGTLSRKSVHNRRYELNRFARFCKSHKIENVMDINKNIMIKYYKSLKISNASKLHISYVLTGFMDYLVDEEMILENIAATIDKPKIYAPKTDFLTFHELESIFKSEAKYSSKKVIDRNLLLLSLFTDLCLRVSEVVNLKLEDVRLDAREIWITRKRNKTDNMPLNDYLVDKFLNWYAMRPQFKGSDSSWVFLSSHGKQLKPRQVHNIVSKALQRAGVIKRKQGPHILRHSGASLKARSGENLIMIQYLLGHENLNTTRRYLHFTWDELSEMVNRSHRFDATGEA